jgi:hypothetical protein
MKARRRKQPWLRRDVPWTHSPALIPDLRPREDANAAKSDEERTSHDHHHQPPSNRGGAHAHA